MRHRRTASPPSPWRSRSRHGTRQRRPGRRQPGRQRPVHVHPVAGLRSVHDPQETQPFLLPAGYAQTQIAQSPRSPT